MLAYHKQARKYLRMAEIFEECGDKKVAHIMHDIAKVCLERHNIMTTLNKRAGRKV